MRHLFTSALLLLVLAVAPEAQVRLSLSAEAGLALNQLGNENQLTVLGQTIPGIAADYPLSAGFTGAVRGRIGTEVLALRVGAGVLTTGTIFDVTTPLLGRDDLSLSMLTGALEAEIGQRLGRTHLYVFGGPELRLLLDSDGEGARGLLDIQDVDRYQTALALGTGARFRIGRVHVGPEIRGTLGLATFSDDRFEFGPLDIRLDEGLSLDNLGLSLAVGLDL